MAKLTSREIQINNEKIIIWEIDRHNAPYSTLYQNKDTKNLDRLFCLE